jgi:plastocyanin
LPSVKKTLIAAAAAALLLVGCGGGGGDSSSGTTSGDLANADVVVTAHDIGFDSKTYDATAGTVTIGYKNTGVIRHTLLIEGVEGFKLVVSKKGAEDSGSVDLKAGVYTIYCDVPGHRPAMEAKLTVV